MSQTQFLGQLPKLVCLFPHPGWIAARAHTGKIGKIRAFFGFFRSMEKIASDGPKWGREDLFPTNPDLADILGRTDLNFEIVFLISWIPKF